MNDRSQATSYPEKLRLIAQSETNQVVSETAGTLAVVVATIDGFEIAAAMQSGLVPSRIAALASSIAAIGDVVSMEAKLGACTSIMINTSAGLAVIAFVRRPDLDCIIMAICNANAVLGNVTYRITAAARTISAA